ncbi:ArnT family glycosyltransferase [Patescibacteria group bacterium]
MKKYLIILILALAALLRFYKLGSYPAFNADEAAIGYNAYSLIETGMDEHANPWPIHFQSFNDYKPGFYFYLVTPFVRVLGLNEWAVRIPGALIGVLSVFVVYLLVKELFKEEKYALASCLLLAISPWHIHFSRGGWEVNVSTFLITLGVWFFVKGVRNQKYYLMSIISFVLSLYTYHAARVVVPLLGLGLLVIYRKNVLKKIKPFMLACLVGLVLFIPLGKQLLGPAGISRAAGVGLFADPGPLNRINEQRGEHDDFQGLIPELLHNKAVNYTLAFTDNWARHFWGEFLFLTGDLIQRNKVPEMGEMYLFDILFLAVGFAIIVKSKRLDIKSKLVLLLWIVLAPTASALTFQSPHALRAHNMVIPLIIISSLGLVETSSWLRKKNLKAGIWLIVALMIWLFARYEHLYWVHMTKEYPFSSQYGVKELITYVWENEQKYQNIVITDKYDQPYILFLFYLKYPPGEFQKNHELTPKDQFGFSTVRSFDKYRFITFGSWDEVRGSYPNSLIVGAPGEIPREANIVKRIYGMNGYEYFDIVAN